MRGRKELLALLRFRKPCFLFSHHLFPFCDIFLSVLQNPKQWLSSDSDILAVPLLLAAASCCTPLIGRCLLLPSSHWLLPQAEKKARLKRLRAEKKAKRLAAKAAKLEKKKV